MDTKSVVRMFVADVKAVFLDRCKRQAIDGASYWMSVINHLEPVCRPQFDALNNGCKQEGVDKKALYITAIVKAADELFCKIGSGG